MGVQLPEIQLLGLFLGSGASPDSGLVSRKQWDWLTNSPVTQEPVGKAALHLPDSRTWGEFVGKLAVKCGWWQQNIKHFEDEQV